MVSRLRVLFFVVLFLGANLGPAVAHHSFSGEFLADKVIEIEGTITEVSFRNPHVFVYIDVKKDGATSNWAVALQNVSVLRDAGIDRNTFAVGQHLQVTGNAGRNNARKIYAITINTGGKSFAMFRDGTPARAADAALATEAVRNDSSIAEQLVGDWAFDVDKRLPGAPLRLQFKRNADGTEVNFDGETLSVGFVEDRFVIVLPRENAGGHAVELQLTGSVEGDRLAGEIAMIKGETRLPNLDASTFTAVRSAPGDWAPRTKSEMQPVDFTGIWQRVIGVGPIGRTNPQLTELGQKAYEKYKRGRYDPALRCVSTGPMRKYADPGKIEFLASTNRLTLLYSSNHDVRRFYFDRKDFNAEREPDVMGESLAHWDGDVLVIETRSMTPTVVTHNSEPTSGDASVVERYWLEDDGRLTMEATLYDPAYYVHPVVRRTQWEKAADQEQDLRYDVCDPDSFYETLFRDGVMPTYFENRPE